MNISPEAFSIVKQLALPKVFDEAIGYVAKQRVTITHVEKFSDGVDATALVFTTSGHRSVDLGIEYELEDDDEDGYEDGYDDDDDYADDGSMLQHSCSCESDVVCAHVAAVALMILSKHGHSMDSAAAGGWQAPQPPRVPAWARELDTALPAPRREVRAELCLFITAVQPVSTRFYATGAATLSMRPGVLGSRDKWIRGTAKWGNIEHLGGSREATRALVRIRAVAERYSSHFSTHDWLDLSRAPGDALWATLRDAANEIAIVSAGKQQLPVEFLDEVGAVEGVVTRKDNHLEVSARLSLRPAANAHAGAAAPAAAPAATPDPAPNAAASSTDPAADGEHAAAAAALAPLPLTEEPWWIGTPTAAFALIEHPSESNERIRLAALTDPLNPVARKLLSAGDPLVIPAADLASFEQEYLPRIQSEMPLVSPDDSYQIPQPAAPTLRLEITYADRQTHLGWQWQRSGRFPRDPSLERPILAALRKVLPGELEALLYPDAGHNAIPLDVSLSQVPSVQFVTEALPAIREVDGVEVVEHSDTPEYKAATIVPAVDIRTEETGDWFDLHVSVQVGGETVEFAELFTALTLGDPIFVLPSGIYFSLLAPEFDRLRQILDEARALVDGDSARFEHGVRVNRHNVDLWSELKDLGIVAAQEAEWWLAMQALGADAEIPSVATPKGIKATLRDYQEHGLAWLHFLRVHGLGGILADDMGLGKTLQTISMMEIAREENPDHAPFLVVAPTSVVSNWASECAKFAPAMNVAVISGMEGKRGTPLEDAVRGANVVVTSYALFRGEAEKYRELNWSGLILDEAQQIKNFASHGHRAARLLGAPFTLVVTGTPLENNLLELWALASLAAPGLLGNRAKFTEFYRTPIEKEQNPDRLALLQRRLRPFLLRRTKDLVASELPPKQEQVIEIDLHPKHRKLYDLRFQRERQKILGLVNDMDANRFQIFKSLTMLRQLALDPALVDAGSAPSAKLDALVELLAEAAEEGHRVLVLSQFTRFLGSARDRTEEAGLDSCYLDGSTTNRGDVIDEFRSGDAPVFFVSLKAGGFGLNLVEADYVVLLDPWWNPAVEAQAIDRTHRIGQERPVFVYRLVASNTIEKKVIALREAKAELFGRVLDGGQATPSTISADDILDLLG